MGRFVLCYGRIFLTLVLQHRMLLPRPSGFHYGWAHTWSIVLSASNPSPLPKVPPVFGFEPSETFDVKLTVRIPNQIISYRPGTAYVLYQAWVQYISFLIPTWYHLSFFLLSFFLSLFLLSFFFLSLSFFFLSFANLMLKMCELCEISPSN